MSLQAAEVLRPKPRRIVHSGRLVAIIVIGAVLWVAMCGGLGLAVMFLKAKKAQTSSPTRAQEQTLLRYRLWESRECLRVYIAALDTVTVDRQVIDCVGESIAVDVAAEEMYRRSWTGPLMANAEGTISFDVHGAQQSAVVNVDVVLVEMPRLSIRQIRVEPDEGPVISVPPPP